MYNIFLILLTANVLVRLLTIIKNAFLRHCILTHLGA